MTSTQEEGRAEPTRRQVPSEDCMDAAAAVLAALSYPLRLRIVAHLLHGEATGAVVSRTLGVDHHTRTPPASTPCHGSRAAPSDR
jgi:hypothetical protein